ncbi:TPA: hypothetical protein ACYQT8_000138 [Streptococcus pneumoniae]|uniref:Uncharacterized protein n=1 Tax=Streptococcus pneumoniae TaxID=1313 RepID=A0AAP5J6I9_STREE|nr:hypothetical protein [Streptococcus pneumoniae]OYL03195.1 hypothetical protein AJ86_02850 [Streptococcus pneumoniae E709]APJ29712.1 hypothetical protein BMJ42_00374 [Streptococcus pneumoniae]EJH01205.1 hypothetical protein SPAR157_0277 [Streptococcus pneumoniae GA54354]EJH17544.1 hypothetical protein SPAR169_0311 [Streptococcus pneumoniae GA62331]MBW5075215.1 hypothetical protein [Streptococcus pneumoniae]
MNRLVNDSRKCEILLFKISIIVVSVIVLVMSIVGAYYFKNCLWDKESLNLILTLDTLFAVFITFFSFSNDKSSNIFGISPNEIIRTQSEVYQFLFTKSFATLLIVTNLLSIIHYFGAKNLIVSFNETYPRIQSSVGIMWLPLFGILIIYFIWLLIEGLKYIRKINYIIQNREIIYFYSQVKVVDKLTDSESKKYGEYIDLYESCRQNNLSVLLNFLQNSDDKRGVIASNSVRIMFESLDKADQIAALNICRNYVARENVLNKEDAEKLLNEIDKKLEISR